MLSIKKIDNLTVISLHGILLGLVTVLPKLLELAEMMEEESKMERVNITISL